MLTECGQFLISRVGKVEVLRVLLTYLERRNTWHRIRWNTARCMLCGGQGVTLYWYDGPQSPLRHCRTCGGWYVLTRIDQLEARHG